MLNVLDALVLGQFRDQHFGFFAGLCRIGFSQNRCRQPGYDQANKQDPGGRFLKPLKQHISSRFVSVRSRIECLWRS